MKTNALVWAMIKLAASMPTASKDLTVMWPLNGHINQCANLSNKTWNNVKVIISVPMTTFVGTPVQRIDK